MKAAILDAESVHSSMPTENVRPYTAGVKRTRQETRPAIFLTFKRGRHGYHGYWELDVIIGNKSCLVGML